MDTPRTLRPSPVVLQLLGQLQRRASVPFRSPEVSLNSQATRGSARPVPSARDRPPPRPEQPRTRPRPPATLRCRRGSSPGPAARGPEPARPSTGPQGDRRRDRCLERPSSSRPARPSGAARRTGAPEPRGCPSTGRHRRPPRRERRRQSEATEDRKGNGPLGGSAARARGAQEGHLEGLTLWLWQGGECLLEDGLEEVTEAA
jgi:hypothetical protein